MNTVKWICRYAFLGLLFIGGIIWCVISYLSWSDLKSITESLEFIDMAANLSPDAIEILENMKLYDPFLFYGKIVTAVIFGALVLLILYHVISVVGKKKLAKIRENKAAKAAEREAAAKIAAERAAAERAAAERAAAERAAAEKAAAERAAAEKAAPQPAQKIENLDDGNTDSAVTEPVLEKSAEKGFCPECGTYFNSMPKFCTKCGFDLSK